MNYLNIELEYNRERDQAWLAFNGTQFFFEIPLSKYDLFEFKEKLEDVLKEIEKVEASG